MKTTSNRHLATQWDSNTLIKALMNILQDQKLFRADFVNNSQYLSMHRLHARVCGLFAQIGIQSGFLVDIGRYYPIDPITNSKGRKQRQAEADISFLDPRTDTPIVLFDYETSDAYIDKMRNKFRFFNTFLKYTPTIKMLVFFITVTGVHNNWEDENDQQRIAFTIKEIPKLVTAFYRHKHNRQTSLVVGTFYSNYLELREFRLAGLRRTHKVLYGSKQAKHQSIPRDPGIRKKTTK